VAGEAFTLAEGLADRGRVSRVCQLALAVLVLYGGGMIRLGPDFRQWAERADQAAAPGTVERVYADIALANTLYESQSRALPLRRGALAMARALGDRQALFEVASHFLVSPGAPKDQEERLRLAREFSRLPREGVRSPTIVRLLGQCRTILMAGGERGE